MSIVNKYTENLFLSVAIITYNQENYISKTLDSILEQNTDFDFEIVIGEDCSHDNTLKICLEYQNKFPNKVRVLENKSNLGIVKNYIRTLNSCKGKYIAQCAGDDYWTDPLKLKKQVDFLEANPDYGMIHTNYLEYYENDNIFSKRKNSFVPTGEVYEHLLFNSFIIAPTVCIRSECFKKFIGEFQEKLFDWKMEDRPFWLFISSQKKVHYLEDETTVYRKTNNSFTNFKNIKKELEYFISSYDVRFYFIHNVREVSVEIEKKLYQKYYKKLLTYYYQLNDFDKVFDVFNELKKYGRSKKDYLLFFSSKYPSFKILTKKIIGY